MDLEVLGKVTKLASEFRSLDFEGEDVVPRTLQLLGLNSQLCAQFLSRLFSILQRPLRR